jgi:hypothetical protein
MTPRRTALVVVCALTAVIGCERQAASVVDAARPAARPKPAPVEPPVPEVVYTQGIDVLDARLSANQRCSIEARQRKGIAHGDLGRLVEHVDELEAVARRLAPGEFVAMKDFGQRRSDAASRTRRAWAALTEFMLTEGHPARRRLEAKAWAAYFQGFDADGQCPLDAGLLSLIGQPPPPPPPPAMAGPTLTLRVEFPDGRSVSTDINDARDCPTQKFCGEDYYGIAGALLAGFDKLGLAIDEHCVGSGGGRDCDITSIDHLADSPRGRWVMFRNGHRNTYPYNHITRDFETQRVVYRFLPAANTSP